MCIGSFTELNMLPNNTTHIHFAVVAVIVIVKVMLVQMVRSLYGALVVMVLLLLLLFLLFSSTWLVFVAIIACLLEECVWKKVNAIVSFFFVIIIDVAVIIVIVKLSQQTRHIKCFICFNQITSAQIWPIITIPNENVHKKCRKKTAKRETTFSLILLISWASFCDFVHINALLYANLFREENLFFCFVFEVFFGYQRQLRQ